MNNQSLDVGRALSFMFEEQDWVKKLIIAIVMLFLSIFVLPYFIFQGYIVEIVRRVGRSQAPELPDWDDWGKYLSEGFMASIALVVYALPILLLVCCAMFPIIALGESGGDEVAGIAVLMMCCVMIIAFIMQFGVYLMYYAGLIRYAETSNFSSFFQFGQLWRFVRENLNDYGLALLVSIGAGMIGSFVPILGTIWAMLVTAHLFGQVSRITRDDLDFGNMAESPASEF